MSLGRSGFTASTAKRAVLISLHRERLWALVELWSDPLGRLLSGEKRHHCVAEALRIGSEWAAPFFATDAFDLAARLGLHIQYTTSSTTWRAHYSGGMITINRRSLEQTALQLSPLAITSDLLERVAVYHELFHHLESRREQVDRILQPTIPTRFGLRRKLRISALREIAAHSFAQRLSRLPLMPSAIDWIAAARSGRRSWVEIATLLDKAARIQLQHNRCGKDRASD